MQDAGSRAKNHPPFEGQSVSLPLGFELKIRPERRISDETIRYMKKMFLTALAGLVLMCGCAQTYVLTLNNGERIQTKGKPKLVDGFYYFKDASGRDARPVYSARVRELAPASMASPDASSMFRNVSKP